MIVTAMSPTTAVVDGLPTIPKEKVSKLETYVKKVYGQIGTILSVRFHGPLFYREPAQIGPASLQHSSR
jgi:hypothetical protein